MVRIIRTELNGTVEQFAEAIRKRPGLYAASIRDVMLRFVCLFMQQALDGECESIRVDILSKTEFHVSGMSATTDGAAAEQTYRDLRSLLIEPHYFSEYLDRWGGLFTAAFASDHLSLQVRCADNLWECVFEYGNLIKERHELHSQQDGLFIEFHCTATHERLHNLVGGDFDYDAVAGLLQRYAFVIPNLRIMLHDHRIGCENTWQYPQGLRSYLHRQGVVRHRRLEIFANSASLQGQTEDGQTVDFRLDYAYHWGTWAGLMSFSNADEMLCHGVHVDAFLEAMAAVINEYAATLENPCYTRPFVPIEAKDVGERTTAIISVWHPSPQSDNSMGWRLTNPEIREPIYQTVYRAFKAWADEHPREMQSVVFGFCADDDDDDE
jgi:DNA gyrase/topoisomerase IV subunit B